MNKRIVLFAVSFCFLLRSNGQVNLPTGSASFSVPMFSWQDDKSRLNSIVALNYVSGNGLRVNDLASNVGQGWSLLAGGVINRIQNGEPDDQPAYEGNGSETDIRKYPAGFLYTTKAPQAGCPEALTKYPIYNSRNQVYKNHNSIMQDRELDYFSFQFNGKAGMFILNQETAFNRGFMLGDSKFIISFEKDQSLVTNTTSGKRTTITAFTIQDDEGLIYKFTKHGMSKVLEYNYCDKNFVKAQHQPKFKNNRVYYQIGFENPTFVNPWIIDSWYLTEIEDALTHRKILFQYAFTRNTNIIAGQEFIHNADKNYTIASFRRSVSQNPEISAIVFPDGHEVTFSYGSERQDFKGQYVLSDVDIKYNSRYLSKYKLNTSYFILNRYGTPITEYQKRVSRLCLRSVQKIGVDLKEDTPPYIFDYYTGSSAPDDFVPPPFFYAKDIWGYYNGNNSKGYNNAPVPLNKKVNELDHNAVKGLCYYNNTINGFFLNPKPNYARNGLLKQIIFPSGGTLTYEYGQNSGSFNGGAVTDVGGVHVTASKATDGGYSNDCSNPIVTKYQYVLADGSTSSLWGLEMPLNLSIGRNFYRPELKKYRWNAQSLFGECYFVYQYPGILSQNQSLNISGLARTLETLSPYMGVLSTVLTIKDIVNLIGGGGNVVTVVIDLILEVASLALTCIGDHSKDKSTTMYHSMDLNAGNPLPTQFKRVEVIEGSSGGIGRTIHDFTSDTDYPVWESTNPAFSSKQRFAPWAYGLPKLTTVKDQQGNIIKQTENVYDATQMKTIITCAKCLRLTSCKCQVEKSYSQRNTHWSDPNRYDDPATYHTQSYNDITVDIYPVYTGRMEISKTIERNFRTGSSTDFVETISEFKYNTYSNFEVREIKTSNSNGDVFYKFLKYSSDFYSGVIPNYLSNNMVSVPISTVTAMKKGGESSPLTYTGETVTEFTQLANGDIRPSRTLEQRFSQPVSSLGWYNGPDNSTSQYKITQEFTYDNNANLIGSKDESGRVVTSIYDYDEKYAVATVVNAEPILDKPAYSSFETTSLGGWTLTGGAATYSTASMTGARSLELTGRTISAPLNTNKPYLLSFWATQIVTVSGGATLVKSAPQINGFTYYEYTISSGTTSIAVTGNAQIDELRLYPRTARMMTVTYEPLIGKTSECDGNNRITYYAYDDLGRLKLVLDEKKNIVKAYEYNNISADKQNGCPGTYGNYLIEEVFTKSNCAPGYIGSDVTYVVPANKYTSLISQADADAKAEEEILSLGQAYANTNGTCQQVFQNAVLSQVFYKDNCPVGFTGGAYTYTVPAGRYSSLVSQADADEQALDELEANGQVYANDPANNVPCTANSDPDWEWDNQSFYCQFVNANEPAHKFVLERDVNPHSPTFNQIRWSDIGPDPDGDCPACNTSMSWTQGLNYSMSSLSLSGTKVNFVFVFTYPSSGTTINLGTLNGNCLFPTSTRTIPFKIGSSVYSIIVSPSGLVQLQHVSGPVPYNTILTFSRWYDLNANAFYSVEKSGWFARNNCEPGQVGSSVQYIVPIYAYASLISQADADNMAQNDVNSSGQNYANANGTCTSTCTFTWGSGLYNTSANISSGSGTGSFSFVFIPSTGGYIGGLLGTINETSCRPSVNRIITVNDGGTSGRVWKVTIYTTGTVSISLDSGPPANNTYPPVYVTGTYNL